jgi:[ribosomal protein S5]-alanine N-acetyltransferase
MFPPFEGRGVATAMVRELITRARQADPDVELFAHTLSARNAPNAILRKLGFQFVGERGDPEAGQIWEWRHRSIQPIDQANPATCVVPATKSALGFKWLGELSLCR